MDPRTAPHAPARPTRTRARAPLAAGLALAAHATLAQAPASPPSAPVGDETQVAAPMPAPSASDAFADFRREFDAGRYAAAEPHARRVLEFAEAAARTPTDEEVQVAVMNLAMTQSLMGDYTAAESSYLRAIELVEASGRPLHARRARAYGGLASAYHEDGRHEAAVENFERAVALTRRHEGLLTEAQLPLLEKYVDSLTELGRFPDALKNHRYVLRIATRRHGEESPELAPTLERIGRWYTRVGLYEQARRTLRRAIDLVQAAEGGRSPKLVGPLTALAQCNRRQILDPDQRFYASPDPERAALYHDPRVAGVAAGTIPVSQSTLAAEAERALLLAVEIAERRTDRSHVQVADVHTQLGDWYQSRALPERALPSYQKAWSAAQQAEQQIEGRPFVEALFGKPTLLLVVRPDDWDKYGARPPTEVETRNVVLEFTVREDGSAARPTVVDDSGDARRAAKTATALESARFRPRFENGQPVPTTGVTFTQPWIVLLPTEAPEGNAATPRAAAPERDGKAT